MKLNKLNEEQLLSWAREWALTLKSPCVIALWGDLGAGKTTFCRQVIRSLLHKPDLPIPSPTFSLIQTYSFQNKEIWHCDMYRLNAPEESVELGLLEAMHQHICLIEWPEKLGHYLPEHRINIHFTYIDADHRTLEIIES